MEFRLLGPVELTADDGPVDLGPPRQRAVLAALLVDPGTPVMVDTLIDRVWGDDPPTAVRNALYSHIARIRRLLRPCGATVERRSGGYVIRIDPMSVDLIRYEHLLEQARAATGAAAERVTLLREALALWRGEALAGVPGAWAEQVRDHLAQRRVSAVASWAALETQLGHADTVIDEVRQAVRRHPLAEPLIGALMRALFAVGRPAEALACYAEARGRLAAELGTEPGQELRELHEATLRDDRQRVLGVPAHPAPAATSVPDPRPPVPSPGPPVPAQLPADVPAFAGRARDLQTLDELLDGRGGGTRAVVISAIAGTAGIGKTSLAVRWAHRVAHRFPDGQLYVNLRGFDPTGAMVAPAEAVRGFLDALGVPPARIPAALEAQAALYRSLLAGRRMLVVLDNARDAEQVRPLLPGAAGCVVVVTSRNGLTGLVAAEGAYPITLDLLSATEAVTLLGRRLGRQRVAAESGAVDDIVARCAGLPLALAIVAARAATRPGTRLEALANELRDGHRLDPFDIGDPATDARSVFSWSYRSLSADGARLFRLLGVHPGPDCSVPAAASLAGWTIQRVRPVLAELVAAHLVNEDRHGRYSFHDLLRGYADELAAAVDSTADRHAATTRSVDHYVHTAVTAALRVNPHRDPITPTDPAPGVTPAEVPDEAAATTWFSAERHVLLATVERAGAAGLDPQVWQLAWATADVFFRAGLWREQVTVHEAALAAASRLGDRQGQAHAHRGLGRSLARQRRWDESYDHYLAALQLYRDAEDHTGQAHIHQSVGYVLEGMGRLRDALDHSERALHLHRATGYRVGEAGVLNSIGWFHAQLGEYADALPYCEQALAIQRELGNRYGEANTWDSLGYVHQHLGDFAKATRCYRSAVDLYQELGDRYYEADTCTRLGETYAAGGRPDAARTVWTRALVLLDELGHPDAEAVRDRLRRADPLATGRVR